MASARVPRRYYHEEWVTRQPHRSNPGGPPRGGPERPADDPRRNPRGGLCGGPGRSAKETQAPPGTTHGKTSGENAGKTKPDERKRPTVITVDKSGSERKWGPFSRPVAWRVGCFWEDMKGKVKVILEKDGTRTEVEVLKRFERGREYIWFKEKKPEQPHQKKPEQTRQQPEGGKEPVAVDAVEESATEDDNATVVPTAGLSEEDPEEREIREKMWLAEKVTSLEKENEELKVSLQVIETRLATQEDSARQVDERCVRLEAAITQIADFIQQQNASIESSRALMNGLVEEVKAHQDNFQKLGMIMQVHERHIVQSGTITQEMAQYINALVQENEQKNLRIASLTKEYQAQADVLRQH